MATLGVALRPSRRWSRRVVAATIATLAMASAASAVSALRTESVQVGPLPELARQRAQVVLTGTLVSDPVQRRGSFGDYVLARLRAEEVHGRGTTTRIRAPVLVIGEPSLLRADLGDRLRIEGRTTAAQDSDLAAVLTTRREPFVLAEARWWHQGISVIRAGVRTAHEPLPAGPQALVPALVDGDDVGMPPELEEDFRTTGLTHLLAVSGSNLTLVLGFVMVLSRCCGVRGRGFALVGCASVVFFVLLARPEPSVLRAAAMGLVGLAGLTVGGRRRGIRALCVAVTVLVLLDPWLARAPGFVLSTTATAGILLFAGHWADALARWMPRWSAEAVAVPLAAQLMCTPVVAALSGQVSLVAVASNVLAAPAVGPATVVGLLSGLVAVGSAPIGQLGGRVAGLPAGWIVLVAERSADMEGASSAWATGALSIALLTVICCVVVVAMPTILSRGRLCVALVVLAAFVVVRPGERAGWPPDRWLFAMCDVGQGDGLVLRAAPRVGVVVDAGPDAHAMDRCLTRLDVDVVALVVLTHFHADHVDGLPGVFDGRSVAELVVSPLPEPADRVAAVTATAAENGAAMVVGASGDRWEIGDVTLDLIGPDMVRPGEPNNASLVIAAQVAGHRVLLTGDAEPEEQSDLLGQAGRLDTDVLKVPHHGSANVDPDFLEATRPSVAVVSAGEDNSYGHPAPHLLALLAAMDVPVFRTDRDGDIVVVERAGRLAVVTEHR
jgi:competence protein ComEC